MSYIGKIPATQGKDAGPALDIDDISSQFNNSTTVFDLTVGSTSVTPHKNNIAVYLSGVLQHPGDAYSLSGSQIKFTEAPSASLDFQGTILSDTRLLTPDNETVTNNSFASSASDVISGSFTTVSSSLASRITTNESYVKGKEVLSGSAQIATVISGSLGTNATLIRSLTAANISGSFTTVSSSLASKVTTLEGTGTTQGVGTTNSPTFADVTATGTVTAQEFHTEFISASVIYDSGSTRFGDTTDDTHAFTGSLTTSGSSLKIDSAGGYSGSATSTGSFGRVEATNYSGDGSALTGISIPSAADISGSFEGGGSTKISGSSTSTGSFGSTHVMGNLNIGTTSSNPSASVTLGTSDANLTISGSVFPESGSHHNLGAATHRWHTLYVADLELKNQRGDWTIIEEEEYLSIRNNKSNKMYKFVLEEIE